MLSAVCIYCYGHDTEDCHIKNGVGWPKYGRLRNLWDRSSGGRGGGGGEKFHNTIYNLCQIRVTLLHCSSLSNFH